MDLRMCDNINTLLSTAWT